MTELQPAPTSYFTIRSFEAAQNAGAVAIEHNLEVIADLNSFLQNEGEQGLPAPIELIDFAHYWTGGRSPSSWDTHYDKANIKALYFPGSQLPQPTTDAAGTTKELIMMRGTTIVEIQTRDYTKPLGRALVRALITPPPKDAAMKASPEAWAAQTKRALSFRGLIDAFTPGFSNAGNPKLEAEAGLRFGNAIVLRRNNGAIQ